MQCPEHPKYTGQRAPRTDCLTCLDLYNSIKEQNVLSPKGTKKEAAPSQVAASAPAKAAPEVYTLEGRVPDRLLCLTANQYRAEIINMLRQILPQYIVFCNSDAGTIVLEEAGRSNTSRNVWKISGDIPVISAAKKKAAIEASTKKVITINPGDTFFSDTLHAVIVMIGYNSKTKTVFFREWSTRELVTLPLKEFEKLELRDVIAEDDFDTNDKLEMKVLNYI